MSELNVIIAAKQTAMEALRQNYQWVDPQDHSQGRVREDLTLAQAKKLRGALRSIWPAATIGTQTYHPLSLIMPPLTVSESDPKHPWVEFLLTNWPNAFVVIGAWYVDTGAQYGTTIIPAKTHFDLDTYQLVEDEPEQIVGTPVYPVHAQAIKIMPDVHASGTMLGGDLVTAPATELYDFELMLGQAPRRWV